MRRYVICLVYTSDAADEEDILKIDLGFIKNNDRIVGNLPYNIASQIILRFLELNKKISDMHFMVQKEMAEVLTSSPGNKSWNKFSVKVAFFYETEILMDISPEAFDIKPKVDSSLVRFKPINSQAFEIKKLFQIIDCLLYTSPSPRDKRQSRMPSSA